MVKVDLNAMIATLTWQGVGSINATVTSPAHSYTEDEIPVYQKTNCSVFLELTFV